MFENLGTNAIVTNACALSGGLLLGFMIKSWFKSERDENKQNNHSISSYSDEQVCLIPLYNIIKSNHI